MLNGQPDQAAFFTVPDSGRPRSVWKKIIDTALRSPADFAELATAKQVAVGSQVSVAPMGCVVLQTEVLSEANSKLRKTLKQRKAG